MKAITVGLAALCLAGIGLSGCGKREATATTGTAKATVVTSAPANLVTNDQLQTQAVEAATAASTPVDGSGPVSTITPSANVTTSTTTHSVTSTTTR
jgi:hypothetical protein